MTKSIRTIRSAVNSYMHSEAYAQYLFRTDKIVSFESWLDFMGAYNNRKKISKPLKIINGGLNNARKQIETRCLLSNA